MDLEEEERYRWWINSQQDPKKFPWTASARPQVDVAAKVMKFAQSALNNGQPYTPHKGDVWHYAKVRELKPVFKMAEFTDAGEFVRHFYVDESGAEVKIPKGYMTVRSNHAESVKAAQKALTH